MAIQRYSETSNNFSEQSGTHAPVSAIAKDFNKDYQTGDIRQIQEQYQSDAESLKGDKIDTGALLPKDMTVKLVRAETANWEMFLQGLYSLTLTFFGLFLGAWISNVKNNTDFTSLEVTATVFFGGFSLVLIVVWIFLKIRQSREGIKVPYEILNQLSDGKE